MLQLLQINQLRNLTTLQLTPGKKFNIIYGANGSGKTSILEAIYYLSLGRSFRTHLPNRIINHNAEQMTLFAQVQHNHQQLPIGISRHRNGNCQIRLARKDVSSVTELSKTFPTQIIHPESHRLLTDGPKLRRQFLDWGVFHVEHQFFSLWQKAQRILKQRNAAIKQHSAQTGITLWDQDFIGISNQLHTQREQYFQQLLPLFEQLAAKLLVNIVVKASYYAGWNVESGLENVLNQALDRDIALGYTQFGPHRADIRLKVNNTPAQDVLSQGQQKLLVYALRLAQGQLLHQLTGTSPVYLIDDLPAELDTKKRLLVTEALQALNSQTFITGAEHTEMEDIIQSDSQLFHVEHGSLLTEAAAEFLEPAVKK